MDSRLPDFVNLTDDGVVMVDHERRFTFVNARAESILSRGAGDLLGADYRDVFPPAVGSAFDRACVKALAEGKFARAEAFAETLGRWIEVRVYPGESGLTVFIADLTPRREMESDLRASEARLVRAQAVAHIGSWEIDLSTREMWASEEAFRIYGLARTGPRMPLAAAQAVTLPEERPRLDEALSGLLAGIAPYDVEFRIRRADDGEIRTVHSLAEVERDDAGRPVKVAGTIRDVTREREIEAGLREMARLEAVGQLSGGIAHDFNNMMTAVRGYAELVAAVPALDDASRADLQQIIETADRAAGLTRQLLAFSRRTVLEPRVVDVRTAVDRLRPMLSRLLGEHIIVDVSGGPEKSSVLVDPTQLDQIIINLAINARDAMPGGGTLSIRTTVVSGADLREPAQPSGRMVALSVSDTGVGMDAAVRARIFEPFYTTKAPGQGSGMGLATVFGIVSQSGGRIEVETAPGQGSTFRILLPFVDDTPAQASGEQAAATRGSGTVMLVEDDPAVRAFVSRTLAGLGYTILEASNGTSCLALLERHGGLVQVLVTDVVMPGMSGHELADRLRRERHGLPVLFMSGFDRERDSMTPDDSTVFLPKPFGSQQLAEAVRAALDLQRD
jgi:two-component system, cell cycle sensor histidine kinase and response regulator CckA